MDFDRNEMDFPLVLAHDVSRFIVEFMDPQSGDWVQEWTLTNTLPREIRITLGLGHLDQFSSHPQDEMVSVAGLARDAGSAAIPNAHGRGSRPQGGGNEPSGRNRALATGGGNPHQPTRRLSRYLANEN